MSEEVKNPGMGWLSDYPDFRDHTVEKNDVTVKLKTLGQANSVKAMLKKAGVAKTSGVSLPASVDLRIWCSPIENQLSLGSCTAQAGVGIMEYFERRAFGRHIDASRLFLYKATRNMLHWGGDTGAYLRSTMASLVIFGVPPEEYWPYTDKRPDDDTVPTYHFDLEPPAFCYAFAQRFQAIDYYRYDPPGTPSDVLLDRIKINLAAGLPSMFGFTVYNSYIQAGTNGMIPFPTFGDRVVGGHAVVAVGYDDSMKIKNSNPGAIETKGALMIRNSWGLGWGMNGYGWLPYDYVISGLAVDWWSLLKNEWIDTGLFKL